MPGNGCELLILGADPSAAGLGRLALGDTDGEGRPEIVTGGRGPSTGTGGRLEPLPPRRPFRTPQRD
ncbi:MAG: hypothetical protein ACM3XS_05440 [Bacteroidota bacterium]